MKSTLRMLLVASVMVLLCTPALLAVSKSYTVYIQTGDIDEAGTDANVYIALWGPNNSGAEPEWYELDAKGDTFERGHNDKFMVTLPADLGWPIERVMVKHDNSGKHAGWYVEWVKVCNGTNCGSWDGPNMTTFYFKRWLSADEADRNLWAEVDRTPAVRAEVPDSFKEEVIYSHVMEVNPGAQFTYKYSYNTTTSESAFASKYTETGMAASINVGSTIRTVNTTTTVDAHASWYTLMKKYCETSFQATTSESDGSVYTTSVPRSQQGKYIVHTMLRSKKEGHIIRGDVQLPMIYVQSGRHDFREFNWGGAKADNDDQHFETRREAEAAAKAYCDKAKMGQIQF